ncbi:MAG: hypothetical protein R3E02_06070 [Blastomonas sp.]
MVGHKRRSAHRLGLVGIALALAMGSLAGIPQRASGSIAIATGQAKTELGILPELVGKEWGSDAFGRPIVAITIADDGRYKIRVGGDTHYVNPGIPTAPEGKSSLSGTVLLPSSYHAGSNGFVIRGTSSRLQYDFHFILTADGNVRYVVTKRKDAGTELFNYAEYRSRSNSSISSVVARSDFLYGKKGQPAVEALLGVKIAELDRLITPVGSAGQRMAAAPGNTSTSPPNNQQIAAAMPVASPQSAPQATPPQTTSSPSPQMTALPPPASVASLDPKAMERKFGTLASLVGTSWTMGTHSVNEIRWDRPGEDIIIRWQGLYGDQERYIVPTADGKSLRYVTRNNVYGNSYEATVPLPKKGRFYLGANAVWRLDCTIKKGAMDCTSQSPDAKQRWQPGGKLSVARSTPERDAALLAALPGQFPDRLTGQYHPTLGVLAEMVGQPWVVVSKPDPLPAAHWTPQLFEIFGNNDQMSLVIDGPDGVVMLNGSDKQQLTGTRAAPNPSNPGNTYRYKLIVDGGGAAQLCRPESYPPYAQICNTWRLSRDGQMALYSIGSQNFLWRIAPMAPVDKATVLGKLHQRYFSFNGAVKSFQYNANGGSMIDHVAQWEKRYCIINLKAREADCSGKKSPVSTTANSIQMNGRSYVLNDKTLTITEADGTKSVWNEVNRAFAELTIQDKYLEKEYRESVRDYNRNMREKREEEARSAARWGQLFGQIASGAFNSNAWQPSTPAMWANGIPGGAVGDMGASRYVAAPQMSAEQRAQADELERFRIRQQIYGTGNQASSSQPYQAAYDQLARDRAESERQLQRDNQARDAQIAADSEAFETQLRRGNSTSGTSGSGSSGSGSSGRATITVTDDAYRRADQQAEAQRVAAAEAEARRREQEAATQARVKAEEAEAERKRQQTPPPTPCQSDTPCATPG